MTVTPAACNAVTAASDALVLGALDPVIEIILVLVQVTDASRSINRLSTSVASKPPGDTV